MTEEQGRWTNAYTAAAKAWNDTRPFGGLFFVEIGEVEQGRIVSAIQSAVAEREAAIVEDLRMALWNALKIEHIHDDQAYRIIRATVGGVEAISSGDHLTRKAVG